jgi:hypothetical protein
MRLLAVSLLALNLSAAVIQGVVLDEESGNPLARTAVSLVPLPGAQSGMISVRAGDRGSFAIPDVRPGWYILRSTRKGFVPAEVGQLRPGRPGMPFEIAPDAQSSFFQLRMRRMGAIAGSVLDENGVGIPDWTVHVYTARKPVRHVAQTKTDDRGNYRIGELEAGSYVVRSGPGALEDDTWLLPTYYKYGTALETAETARVRAGETQPDVVIRPVKGRLIQLAGSLSSTTTATLTLITDTGRQVLATGVNAPFTASVPPGAVEFVAEGARCGGYVRILADHDVQGIRVACGTIEPPQVFWMSDAGRAVRQDYPLLVRRVDPDGTGPARALKLREPITPGHWEFQAQVGSDSYVRSIAATLAPRADTKNDGWFGLDLGTSSQIVVTLSNKPASVSGVVTAGGKPVTGAAVYLELYDPESPNTRLQLIEGRSDPRGNYRFNGLTPGRYRVLSSFDFDPEDRVAIERAPLLSLHEGESVEQALELALP